MTTTQTRWNQDLASVQAALASHVIEIDGQQYLAADAPKTLAHLHGQLISVGYANGWM